MWLYGRNPVLEALEGGTVQHVLLAKGVEERFVRQIKKLTEKNNLRIEFVPRIELDQLAQTTAHQGIMAEVAELKWAQIDDILDHAEKRGDDLLIVLLDGITDPRNFGAIIRSAEVLGAHGVVVEERRSAPLSPVVAKTAAGATSYLPIAQTKNMPRLITALQENEGVWVYGAAGEAAQDVANIDFSGKVALVIGAEGEGLRRLVREKCDDLVCIPTQGYVESLNASVAAGVMLYAVGQSRNKGKSD